MLRERYCRADKAVIPFSVSVCLRRYLPLERIRPAIAAVRQRKRAVDTGRAGQCIRNRKMINEAVVFLLIRCIRYLGLPGVQHGRARVRGFFYRRIAVCVARKVIDGFTDGKACYLDKVFTVVHRHIFRDGDGLHIQHCRFRTFIVYAVRIVHISLCRHRRAILHKVGGRNSVVPCVIAFQTGALVHLQTQCQRIARAEVPVTHVFFAVLVLAQRLLDIRVVQAEVKLYLVHIRVLGVQHQIRTRNIALADRVACKVGDVARAGGYAVRAAAAVRVAFRNLERAAAVGAALELHERHAAEQPARVQRVDISHGVLVLYRVREDQAAVVQLYQLGLGRRARRLAAPLQNEGQVVVCAVVRKADRLGVGEADEHRVARLGPQTLGLLDPVIAAVRAVLHLVHSGRGRIAERNDYIFRIHAAAVALMPFKIVIVIRLVDKLDLAAVVLVIRIDVLIRIVRARVIADARQLLRGPMVADQTIHVISGKVHAHGFRADNVVVVLLGSIPLPIRVNVCTVVQRSRDIGLQVKAVVQLSEHTLAVIPIIVCPFRVLRRAVAVRMAIQLDGVVPRIFAAVRRAALDVGIQARVIARFGVEDADFRLLAVVFYGCSRRVRRKRDQSGRHGKCQHRRKKSLCAFRCFGFHR